MTDDTYPTASSGKPIALEARSQEADGRRCSPSIARNRDALRDAFLGAMPNRGRILEIASGTGEHGIHITNAAPDLTWIFSDPDPGSRTSQAAWMAASAHDRFEGPLDIDVTDADWTLKIGAGAVDGVVSVNMIHIAPFAAAQGLVTGAARVLEPAGKLFLYGPFSRNGKMAPSNAGFSEDLKRRDPSWGVRDLERDIVPLALTHGLALDAVIEMPANNLSVVFVLA